MKFTLAILMFAEAAAAQDLYVYSNLQTDGAGNATATASSTTDYNTSYYYDMLANEWLWFQPDNSYSENLVCSKGAATGYYNMRPSNGMCSITYTQNMYMFCSGFSGAGQYYTTYNPLAIYIAATPWAASLTASRSGTQIQRNYP
jgi:hypothetical protein